MPMVIEPETVPLVKSSEGVITVGKSRVTLESLIAAFRNGASAETIADQFPTLSLADVYSTIAYSLRHPQTVDAYLTERSKQREVVRKENEQRFPPDGIRARLLARKTSE